MCEITVAVVMGDVCSLLPCVVMWLTLLAGNGRWHMWLEPLTQPYADMAVPCSTLLCSCGDKMWL
jgi:hypothetical protein